MPPLVQPEEIPEGTTSAPVSKLTTSRKWMLQVSLLFGLLALSRWSRQAVPAPLAAARPTAPVTQPPPLKPAVPEFRQTHYSVISETAITGLVR